MRIVPAGSQASAVGPAEHFTGSVRRDPLFEAPPPATIAGSLVTFEPGARTAWHRHPLGQVLIVTAGYGWVQSWTQPRSDVRPGDVVCFEPDEKHWHGATDRTAMSHIALVQTLDGHAVEWLEHVADEDYLARAMP